MRTGPIAALLLAAATTAACGRGLFRQYEYQEDIYLSLDGSATVYVNSSVPALDALRGATFDPSPNARVDTDAVRAFFTTPVTRVARIATSRRSNRRFLHVRLEVQDIRRLAEAAPFSWAKYEFDRDGDLYKYRQTLQPAAGRAVANVGWTGRELVAFRLHLPSKVADHNAGADNLRGNILVWEQTLADRLHGVPLALEVRIETQSILYRTLWLFAATLVAVAITFAAIILFLFRGKTTPSGWERHAV